MSLSDFGRHRPQVCLLQSSLNTGRLGHAYLFTGTDMGELEAIARTLAKVVNCLSPPKIGVQGLPLDSCDVCSSCKRIDQHQHPDVYEVRPESKLRQIRIDTIRELIRTIHLKPLEARFKVGIISWADRLNKDASNAFLKTLEEPPEKSLFLLLTSQPSAMLETVRSRCLHLAFVEAHAVPPDANILPWLTEFVRFAAKSKTQPLERYQLLAMLLNELGARRKTIEKQLTAESPLQKYPDLDEETQELFETELAASIEAEYRHQRSELLSALLWWLRDVWLLCSSTGDNRLGFPTLREYSSAVAARITPKQALDNLKVVEQVHRMLAETNVQERLALETGLLKLNL